MVKATSPRQERRAIDEKNVMSQDERSVMIPEYIDLMSMLSQAYSYLRLIHASYLGNLEGAYFILRYLLVRSHRSLVTLG